MKKIVLVSGLVCIVTMAGYSQVYKNSIGLKFSQPNRFMPTVNYQLGLGAHSRLSFNTGAIGAFGTDYKTFYGTFSTYYQHVWNIKGGLNWFIGAGVSYGYGFLNDGTNNLRSHNLRFGPQIGLEYDFNQHNVPLLLSVDMRPSLGYTFNHSLTQTFSNNVGLSLKYTFGTKK